MDPAAQEKLSFFSSEATVAVSVALIGDFLWWTIIGHYIAGVIMWACMPKLKGFLPKLLLVVAIIIPGPLLTVGIALAIVFQNKLLAKLAITVATVYTGGAAAAAEKVGAKVAEKVGEKMAEGAAKKVTEKAIKYGTKKAGEKLEEKFEGEYGVPQGDDKKQPATDEQLGALPEPTEEGMRTSFPAPEGVPSFTPKAEEEVRPTGDKEKTESQKENMNEKPQEPTPSTSEEQGG